MHVLRNRCGHAKLLLTLWKRYVLAALWPMNPEWKNMKQLFCQRDCFCLSVCECIYTTVIESEGFWWMRTNIAWPDSGCEGGRMDTWPGCAFPLGKDLWLPGGPPSVQTARDWSGSSWDPASWDHEHFSCGSESLKLEKLFNVLWFLVHLDVLGSSHHSNSRNNSADCCPRVSKRLLRKSADRQSPLRPFLPNPGKRSYQSSTQRRDQSLSTGYHPENGPVRVQCGILIRLVLSRLRTCSKPTQT